MKILYIGNFSAYFPLPEGVDIFMTLDVFLYILPEFCGIFLSLDRKYHDYPDWLLIIPGKAPCPLQIGHVEDTTVSYIDNKHDLIILDRLHTNLSTVIIFSGLY